MLIHPGWFVETHRAKGHSLKAAVLGRNGLSETAPINGSWRGSPDPAVRRGPTASQVASSGDLATTVAQGFWGGVVLGGIMTGPGPGAGTGGPMGAGARVLMRSRPSSDSSTREVLVLRREVDVRGDFRAIRPLIMVKFNIAILLLLGGWEPASRWSDGLLVCSVVHLALYLGEKEIRTGGFTNFGRIEQASRAMAVAFPKSPYCLPA